MRKKIGSIVSKLRKKYLSKNESGYKSFSQAGEDMIIRFLLSSINLKEGIYIDIGAHHPLKFSNTHFLYESGWQGINVEANPLLLRDFIKKRKKDINLNFGVMDKREILDFYSMSSSTMSTFSKEEADNLVKQFGFKVIKKLQIPADTVMNIINQYSPNHYPEILLLDVEGVEEKIIRSIDFTSWRPVIICCETIPYSVSGIPNKNEEIVKYLETKNYMVFADTFLNSIFVDRVTYSKRGKN